MNNKFAYWLGFLAADGWVNRNTLGFALKREDRESVEYMANITAELTNNEVSIKDYDAKCGDNYYPTTRFTVNSKELVEALRHYGIVEAKSYKDIDFISYIPDKYKIAFIVGYFDGDGSITLMDKENKHRDIVVTITGRKIALESMNNILGGNWSIQRVRETDTFVMSKHAKNEIEQFINAYLELSKEIKTLNRKLERIKIAKQWIDKSKQEKESREQHKIDQITCQICGNQMNRYSTMCLKCYHEYMRKNIPNQDILEDMLKSMNYTEIGNIYNVSGNAVKKWAISYGLYERQIAKHDITDGIVLRDIINTLSIKESSVNLGIPEWKITDILKRCTGDKYKAILITGSNPVMSTGGHIFISARSAARNLGVDRLSNHIANCAKGNRLTCAGYGWIYLSKEEFKRMAIETVLDTPDTIAYKEIVKIYNEIINQ